MQTMNPVAELHKQFSSPDATARPWSEAQAILEQAQIFWLSTVRPDGRPHVTPLFAVWLEGAVYFCTGEGERKAKNLLHNEHCVFTTGCNTVEGLDVVVEGKAIRLRDETKLKRVAALYLTKYEWPYAVRDGAYVGEEGNVAQVYEVVPTTVFGFGKSEPFSQTRWRFQTTV